MMNMFSIGSSLRLSGRRAGSHGDIHSLRVGCVGLAAALVIVGCSANSEDADDTPTEDSAGSSEGALTTPPGFVAPHLDPDAARDVLGNYAHLDPTRMIADNLLTDAVVYFDANKSRISNKSYIGIVDFSKHSGKNRFFLVDMTSGKVEPHKVAHGAGSEDGNGYAKYFSDRDGSHQSSLGFVLTGSVFSSNHGRSLLLDGLSSTNLHMRPREIIIHGAGYVNESSARQGNSWGCFAFDMSTKDGIITKVKDGALLYANLGKPNTGTRPTGPTGPREPTDGTTDGGAPTADTDGGAPAASCSKDGDCNPGSNGSGKICVSNQCVPGCHQDWQCPGSTMCVSGQCQ